MTSLEIKNSYDINANDVYNLDSNASLLNFKVLYNAFVAGMAKSSFVNNLNNSDFSLKFPSNYYPWVISNFNVTETIATGGKQYVKFVSSGAGSITQTLAKSLEQNTDYYLILSADVTGNFILSVTCSAQAIFTESTNLGASAVNTLYMNIPTKTAGTLNNRDDSKYIIRFKTGANNSTDNCYVSLSTTGTSQQVKIYNFSLYKGSVEISNGISIADLVTSTKFEDYRWKLTNNGLTWSPILTQDDLGAMYVSGGAVQSYTKVLTSDLASGSTMYINSASGSFIGVPAPATNRETLLVYRNGQLLHKSANDYSEVLEMGGSGFYVIKKITTNILWNAGDVIKFLYMSEYSVGGIVINQSTPPSSRYDVTLAADTAPSGTFWLSSLGISFPGVLPIVNNISSYLVFRNGLLQNNSATGDYTEVVSGGLVKQINNVNTWKANDLVSILVLPVGASGTPGASGATGPTGPQGERGPRGYSGNGVETVWPSEFNSPTNLNAAIAALSSGNYSLYIMNNIAVTGNLVVPDRIEITACSGAQITIPENMTLTINSSFMNNQLNKIFNCEGSGASQGRVIFGLSSTYEVYPEWWGANWANADNSSYITQALNSRSVSGTIVRIPEGIVLGNRAASGGSSNTIQFYTTDNSGNVNTYEIIAVSSILYVKKNGVVINSLSGPIDSVSGTPEYVGQEAFSGGQIYKAVGTSSSGDWKQITT